MEEQLFLKILEFHRKTSVTLASFPECFAKKHLYKSTLSTLLLKLVDIWHFSIT